MKTLTQADHGVPAGQLRERVTIEIKGTTGTGPGKPVSWTTVAADVPARVTPLNAIERVQAQAMGSAATYEVELRYRADVTPTNRLVWAGHTLQIHGVRWDRPNARLLLDCSEVV